MKQCTFDLSRELANLSQYYKMYKLDFATKDSACTEEQPNELGVYQQANHIKHNCLGGRWELLSETISGGYHLGGF